MSQIQKTYAEKRWCARTLSLQKKTVSLSDRNESTSLMLLVMLVHWGLWLIKDTWWLLTVLERTLSEILHISSTYLGIRQLQISEVRLLHLRILRAQWLHLCLCYHSQSWTLLLYLCSLTWQDLGNWFEHQDDLLKCFDVYICYLYFLFNKGGNVVPCALEMTGPFWFLIDSLGQWRKSLGVIDRIHNVECSVNGYMLRNWGVYFQALCVA